MDKTLNAKSQLEEKGIILDAKWSFNPVKTYAPKRRELLNFMQDLDSVQACNRFEWVGGPRYLPKWRIEQMLYMRGSLAFYKVGHEFKILPFVSNGQLNEYGLLTKLKPIPYNGQNEPQKGISYESYDNSEYDIEYYNDPSTSKTAVILFDRINGFNRTNGLIPKFALQQTICQEIVNRLCFLNINLVNSQGKNIILVKDPKQAKAVQQAFENVFSSDKSYALVKSMFEIQVINNDIKNDEQSIWEDTMSWNNLRLEGLGISNNGLFNKKEREITAETSTNVQQTQITGDAFFSARKAFIKQIREVFANDDDFKKDFKDFDVVDLRRPKEYESSNKNEGVEDDEADDTALF